jgi:hypothetical protein
MVKQKEPAGPLIAIIVIVIILALGGLYYLVQEIKDIRESGMHTALQSL